MAALEADKNFAVAFGVPVAIFLVLVDSSHVKVNRLEVVGFEARLDDCLAEHFNLLAADCHRGGVFFVLRRQRQRQDNLVGSLRGVSRAFDANGSFLFCHESFLLKCSRAKIPQKNFLPCFDMP